MAIEIISFKKNFMNNKWAYVAPLQILAFACVLVLYSQTCLQWPPLES